MLHKDVIRSAVVAIDVFGNVLYVRLIATGCQCNVVQCSCYM